MRLIYSGRFKLDDAGALHSQLHDQDQQAVAIEVEPFTCSCCWTGVSAGKSSVINGLLGEIAAEVSALPSTDKATTYKCEVEGIDLINLQRRTKNAKAFHDKCENVLRHIVPSLLNTPTL